MGEFLSSLLSGLLGILSVVGGKGGPKQSSGPRAGGHRLGSGFGGSPIEDYSQSNGRSSYLKELSRSYSAAIPGGVNRGSSTATLRRDDKLIQSTGKVKVGNRGKTVQVELRRPGTSRAVHGVGGQSGKPGTSPTFKSGTGAVQLRQTGSEQSVRRFIKT